MLEFEVVPQEIPSESNLIVGQTHFIKTVEDMYEAVVNTVPQGKFGLAFNEASGPCLTRSDGNDEELRNAAIRNAQAIGAGHVFVLILRNAYPINLLNVVQNIPEVCSIFCATANPVEVIVAKPIRDAALWAWSMAPRRKASRAPPMSPRAKTSFARSATNDEDVEGLTWHQPRRPPNYATRRNGVTTPAFLRPRKLSSANAPGPASARAMFAAISVNTNSIPLGTKNPFFA